MLEQLENNKDTTIEGVTNGTRWKQRVMEILCEREINGRMSINEME